MVNYRNTKNENEPVLDHNVNVWRWSDEECWFSA